MKKLVTVLTLSIVALVASGPAFAQTAARGGVKPIGAMPPTIAPCSVSPTTGASAYPTNCNPPKSPDVVSAEDRFVSPPVQLPPATKMCIGTVCFPSSVRR